LPQGEIEFLGREDAQVKVQGHRVELGEIEAALLAHQQVRAAVVTAAGEPRGHRRLVAYVVPARPELAAAAAAGHDEAFGEMGEVLTDPLQRLEHKLRRLGVRRLPCGDGTIRFERPEATPALAAAHLSRRSHRDFLAEPLPLARLGDLLACLAPLEIGGLPRYRYASAGGLYPVQAYLYAAPGRVEGLAAGTYYYQPEERALAPLAPDARLAAGVHAAVNRAAFAGSAFSLFLVGELAAIQPLYGALARDFCLLEAGYMSQLLMQEAGKLAIGLCPIGGMDQAPLGGLLGLGETHVALHSLVGGPIDPALVAALPEEPAAGAPARGREPSPDWIGVLRRWLARTLPEALIPSAFVILDELPLTANGKVDRQRLPALESLAAAAPAGHVAPRSDLERELAAMLSEILAVERIGVGDNFYSLGASSVHLIRLANRLRERLGRDLPAVELFRCASIGDLAALVATGDGGTAGAAVASGESRARTRLAARAGRRAGGGAR
ncbi:MAG TPA: nitroreductase family protein, partial [Thermoanaerobaculia bacterium]|nr:nitroreductase family protein [Thermoanaerobaculia bacterium]